MKAGVSKDAPHVGVAFRVSLHSVAVPVRPRVESCFRRLFHTPYWTTFELPAIDMNAASVGIVDQIVAGRR